MAAHKTETLYLGDAYTAEFSAQVVSCESTPDGFAVALDRSYFYPESGGQRSDRGRIGSATVTDVREAGAGVVHLLSAAVEPGPVACEIDWERRFDHMQHHTGQHVLSRAFIEVADLHTVSFHMGDDTCTIDLEGNGFGDEAVARAEAAANDVVADNRPVVITHVTPDALLELNLRRSVPEGVTDIRLVEVKDFDVIPCCGTHVRCTGELSVIKVIRHEKVKNAYRVYFKVGRRAVIDYGKKHDVLQQLSRRLTTSVDDIAAKVEKLEVEGRASKRSLQRVSKRLAALERDEIVREARDLGGVKLMVRHFPEGDDDFVKLLSNELKDEPNSIAILGAETGSVICSASPDVNVDLAGTVVDLATQCGGRGGGKQGFAQVRLPEGVDVDEFLRRVADAVAGSM